MAQAPDSSEYFYKKGLEEKTAKRYLVASGYFEQAIRINPGYKEAYLANAYVFLEMRRTDEAKENFLKLYELDPGNPIAGKELMEIYFNYHEYENAIAIAKKCKSCPNADKVIALSYIKLEDYAGGEKLLIKLIQNNPNDADLNYTLGRAYVDMEQETKAIPYYQKALELEPARNSWLFELGLLYFNADDYKNAIVYFNKAAEKGFPQSLDFSENLGYSYIFSGDIEKGEKILLNISEKKKGNKEILRDLAQVYYDHKMYDKSLEFCQKLMELDLKDGKALYQAGLCFIRKGQKERGQQMCDKAIELDPSLRILRQKMMSEGL
jgi:tetratricopeptide (TPR) repeat protein